MTRPVEWMPIETAPKDGTFILAWCERWRAPATLRWGKVRGFSSRGFVTEGGVARGYLPTHWMPLPSPPKETA